MTNANGVDFEAIARGLAYMHTLESENEKHAKEIESALKEAYEQGKAEGMRASVIAQVPSFNLYENFVSNSHTYEDDYQWLLSQIGVSEVVLPKEQDFEDLDYCNGWNQCLEEIKRLNAGASFKIEGE